MIHLDTVELAMQNLADSVFRIIVLANDSHRESLKEYIEYIRENWDDRHSGIIIEILERAFSFEE